MPGFFKLMFLFFNVFLILKSLFLLAGPALYSLHVKNIVFWKFQVFLKKLIANCEFATPASICAWSSFSEFFKILGIKKTCFRRFFKKPAKTQMRFLCIFTLRNKKPNKVLRLPAKTECSVFSDFFEKL